MRSRSAILLLSLTILATFAPTANAQRAVSAEPVRPELPAGLDPNEAGSYVLYAQQYLESNPAKAFAAAYWGSRLDPTNADALFLRWRAAWLSNPDLGKRLQREKPKAPDIAEAKRIDSLYWRAMLREPFIIANGMKGMFVPSMELVRAVLAKQPDQVGLWVYQAATFHRQHQFDSTLVSLRHAIEALDRLEQRGLRPVYESREMFHYAIGKTQFVLGRPDSARAAFQAALSEDLAFYPAHAALGTLAWTSDHDVSTAIAEFELAIELFRDDAVVYYDYGTILLESERWSDALAQFDRAVALEPWFPDIHHNRGIALDRLGRRDEAVAAYLKFESLAPRRMSAEIEKVSSRIETLIAPLRDSVH